MIGAIVIRSAGRTSAFRTSILSPRLTPTFRRTSPSIRMMPLPSSSCMTRQSFDDVDLAVRPDDHRLPLHERRSRRLELDVFGLDAIHGQLAPHAEKSTRRLDLDVFRLDRRDLRTATEIDVDIFGLQTPVDTDGPAGVEVLGLDGAFDLQRPAG